MPCCIICDRWHPANACIHAVVNAVIMQRMEAVLDHPITQRYADGGGLTGSCSVVGRITPNCRSLPRWAAVMLATALMSPTAASCADSRPGHPVAGVVWISPTCAGAQREGELCRAPLANVEVRLSDESGRVAASATTNSAGAFAMRAPTGRYRLHVAGIAKVPRCPHLTITLPMGKPAPVELECDSGMR